MTAGALAAIEAKLAAGDAAGARAGADALLSDSTLDIAGRVSALKVRARAHESLGNLRAAIADLEGVLALAPNDARACNELGIVCADAGAPEHALQAFRRATMLDPGYARGWNNYGNALRSAGRTDAAADAFARAVEVDPAYALAWSNLGAARREQGDDAAAEAALSRALSLNASQRAAVFSLAGLRRDHGQIDAAASLYEQAVRLDPRDANAAFLLGSTLMERDDVDAARTAFDAALSRDSRLLRASIARQLPLRMVPADGASLDAERTRYAAGLQALEADLPARAAPLSAERTIDELRWTNFLLAYRGEDDLPLQRHYARITHGVLSHRAPEWMVAPARRARAERIRIGFMSAFFRDGTAGRYFEHWITDLPRDRFEVLVYTTQPTIDALGQRLAARADSFRHCPRWRPSQLASRVRNDGLDILLYPEIGMDPTTFAIASLRLAPRQCAAWGHPVSTGLPTIDAFFTCGEMEPDDADEHYSEALVRLPGIGTRYAMPVSNARADRNRFGFPEGVPLFLCPQSAFKIHPDNDALFARVLAEAPTAHLVMFDARHPALTNKLKARLVDAAATRGIDIEQRLHFVGQCDHDDYLCINASCDAMLDTLRWSGGNTALDALACGLPIVTLPGRFMRGRQSAAMLRLAGADDLIARDPDDYVRIAVRLATDGDWHAQASKQIREGRNAVFDDPSPIHALDEALQRIARE